ncbi:MAG: hypothetical protein FRX49_07579 [Trebouxia sp. A1-2]|nr:MAG: hypothetical protein FRX49_07579 [Trebouxia sp. A1-2]
MVVHSASDSSFNPPPAKRNRPADGQPDRAAPTNHSWAADASAAVTQAGPAGQAPAAKHASPIRQRGWFPAQLPSLQAAPALQASAHDVSARPNSSLKLRSLPQDFSPLRHTAEGLAGIANLPNTAANHAKAVLLGCVDPLQGAIDPLKGSADLLAGVLWRHKVWQERVRAQLQGPGMAVGEAVHTGRLASPRAVEVSARAAGDRPRSCESGLGGSVAWHRGRRPDLSDPIAAPRGAISSPRGAASGPRGAFSTPRMLVFGSRGSARWSDAWSSSPRPEGSKRRLGRSNRRSSSRCCAEQYSLRPSRSRSGSPPRRSAEQRRSTPTSPKSRHSVQQPRDRLGSCEADCFSRRSAELPIPRAACMKPSASSRRLAEDDLPSAALSSILHSAAASTLPPPPPFQPPVKAGNARQMPSQKPHASVKSPFLLASRSSAKAGSAGTDKLSTMPSLQCAASSPGAVSLRDQTVKGNRSCTRTQHMGSSLSRHAAEAQPFEHRHTHLKSSTEAKTKNKTRRSSSKATADECSRPGKVSSVEIKQAQPRDSSQAWHSPALPTSSSDAAHTAPPPGSSSAAAVASALASLPGASGAAAELSGPPDAAHTTLPTAATSAAPALAPLPVGTSLLLAPRLSGSVPTDPRKRPLAVKSLFGIDSAASPIHKVLPSQVNADKAFFAGDSCQATSDQLKASPTDLRPGSSQHAQHGSAPHFLQRSQRAQHGYNRIVSQHVELSPAALSTSAVATTAPAVPSEPLYSNLSLAKQKNSNLIRAHLSVCTSSATSPLEQVRQSQPHDGTSDFEAAIAAVTENGGTGLPSAVVAAKQLTGGDIREPTWDEAIKNSGALQLEAKVWYYLDPKGNTQGPCSLEQLIFWLELLKHEKHYQKEYEDFKEVSVWIASMAVRIPLTALMHLHSLSA